MTKQKPGNLTAGWNWDYSRLRVIACLAIIILHTFNYSLLGAGKFGYPVTAAGEFWGHFFEYVNLWAVPVFVMVTGALLLDPAREITSGKIFKKYIARVGSALLIFGLVFIFVDMALGDLPVSGAGFGRGLVQLLTGHSWSHMWYLYLLIGIYLLLPFFRKVAAASSTQEMRYLLIVLLAFLSLLPILGIWGIETDYRFSVATIYPFYLFLGYAMQNGQVKLPKWAAWVTLVASVAVLAVVTLWGSDSVVNYFASYNSVVIVALAMSIFSLLTHGAGVSRAPGSKFGETVLRSLDGCSFGIYLIQMLFIKLLIRVWGLNPFASPWMFPVMIVGIALASWLVIWLLRLIPGVKKVI